LRALKPEVSRRLAHIATCEDAAVTLGRDARLRVDGVAVARIIRSGALLRPALELIGADNAGEQERNAARDRLDAWLAKTIAEALRPLVGLDAAWREQRLPPAIRGVAFRLVENGGALDRAREEGSLDDDAMAALQRCGVRVGRHSIFMPLLIKPCAAHVLAVLWHVSHPHRGHGLFLPRPGALSAPLDQSKTWGECAAAGYRPCGRCAIRFDIAERLAEALDGAAQTGDAALARLIGRPARDLPGVLTSLGYRRDEAANQWRTQTPRPRKTKPVKHGPFAELADLLPDANTHRRRRDTPA
jgi:ATP-dependent RNA helicase SUPV3L1/SUV3